MNKNFSLIHIVDKLEISYCGHLTVYSTGSPHFPNILSYLVITTVLPIHINSAFQLKIRSMNYEPVANNERSVETVKYKDAPDC